MLTRTRLPPHFPTFSIQSSTNYTRDQLSTLLLSQLSASRPLTYAPIPCVYLSVLRVVTYQLDPKSSSILQKACPGSPASSSSEPAPKSVLVKKGAGAQQWTRTAIAPIRRKQSNIHPVLIILPKGGHQRHSLEHPALQPAAHRHQRQLLPLLLLRQPQLRSRVARQTRNVDEAWEL